MTSQNKKFFKGEFYRLLIAVAVLCGASAAPGVEAGGEVRYLAAAGDDAADGKTPATAWRTIKRANAALPAGATLRLKCGDAFYGGLLLPSGPDAAHPTVLTSWGEGPKPVISATKNLKPDPSGWQDLTHCRWRISLANPSNFTGIATDDCNPGFLLVDGEVKGWKRFCHADLVSPWDFLRRGRMALRACGKESGDAREGHPGGAPRPVRPVRLAQRDQQRGGPGDGVAWNACRLGLRRVGRAHRRLRAREHRRVGA